MSNKSNLLDCHTGAMAADISTKHFVNPQTWPHAFDLIGIVDGKFAKRYSETQRSRSLRKG